MSESPSRSLWQAEIVFGEAEHVRPNVIHGMYFFDVLWRLGAFCPSTTFPSDRTVVSGDVARQLRDLGVPLTRVPVVASTLPELDWRAWDGEWKVKVDELVGTLDIDNFTELVVPWHDVTKLQKGSSPKLAAADLRRLQRRVSITEQPDLWFVDAKSTPTRVHANSGSWVTDVEWGSHTHQIPWLDPGMIWVEEPVRRVLDGGALPGSVEWKPVPVVGE